MVKKKSLEWRNCSEQELDRHLAEWVGANCRPGVLLLLEGGLGAGKSSFARAAIRHLARLAGSQGSPTFPLVQEYRADAGFPVYHMDLYRLNSEEDLEQSGMAEQIDAPEALVLVEWSSLFPGFFSGYLKPGAAKKVFLVEIEGSGNQRDYRISSL
jgi:tRNA threonylcarbamoyladenosine biosynthesis protein TsaE